MLGISARTYGCQSKMNGSSEDAHHPRFHVLLYSAYPWLIAVIIYQLGERQ